jgi:CheY-like chemotaxis protein
MLARILLADPDEFLMASYRDCLCERGATVATATTGLECVEQLESFAPDLLVLEPELLWGGGEGVLAVIHEQPELRPAFVILLSYARDRRVLHGVSRFKVDDYQRKPLTAARLADRIGKLLGSQGVPLHASSVVA